MTTPEWIGIAVGVAWAIVEGVRSRGNVAKLGTNLGPRVQKLERKIALLEGRRRRNTLAQGAPPPAPPEDDET